jgi:tRNA A37 threonylcarbamoyladenosine dehydratase
LHPEDNEHITTNIPPPSWQDRTRILLGDSAMERLAAARVCVVGLGAVGGYVAEGLARAGVGQLRLVDFDAIKESNINRQILALRSTLGRMKVEAAAERVLDINPDAKVDIRPVFASADTMPALLSDMDLLVDAVDSLTPKVDILQAARRLGVPAYSALGAATRLDAGEVAFGPLFSAKGCPLGRLVRKGLRRRGVADGDLWCVFSREERNLDALREPEAEASADEYQRGRRRKVLGSMPTLTGLFGLRLAHEAVLRLSGTAVQ